MPLFSNFIAVDFSLQLWNNSAINCIFVLQSHSFCLIPISSDLVLIELEAFGLWFFGVTFDFMFSFPTFRRTFEIFCLLYEFFRRYNTMHMEMTQTVETENFKHYTEYDLNLKIHFYYTHLLKMTKKVLSEEHLKCFGVLIGSNSKYIFSTNSRHFWIVNQ